MKNLLSLLTFGVFSMAWATPPSGGILTVRTQYTGSNVTTAGWTTIVASMPYTSTNLEIFDSSGQVLYLGIGSAGNEIPLTTILPGGNGILKELIMVPAGSRISLKAVSANPASSTENDINFYK